MGVYVWASLYLSAANSADSIIGRYVNQYNMFDLSRGSAASSLLPLALQRNLRFSLYVKMLDKILLPTLDIHRSIHVVVVPALARRQASVHRNAEIRAAHDARAYLALVSLLADVDRTTRPLGRIRCKLPLVEMAGQRTAFRCR